jgi:hypothetical protein
MRFVKAIAFMLLVSLFASCGGDDENDAPVAQVGDNTLTKADIIAAIGSDATTQQMEDFAREWVQQIQMETVIKNRLQNTPKDIALKVKAYEQTLYLFAYEQQEISKLLDTVVTQQEIELEGGQQHATQELIEIGCVQQHKTQHQQAACNGHGRGHIRRHAPLVGQQQQDLGHDKYRQQGHHHRPRA